MEVVTCRSCGKLFNYIQGPRICPTCAKKLEEKFIEVKKYVYANPKVELNELSKAMDVSVRQIKSWVREERLCFTDDSPIGIECENCGATIKTGRFCKQCKDKLSNTIKDAAGLNRPKGTLAPKPNTSKDSKMRFLD